jgi:hypothetical protein
MIKLSLIPAAAILAALVGCTETLTNPVNAVRDQPSFASGNGFPQGGHDYHLNLVGVPKDKTNTLDNNEGHRIFVQLESDNVVTNPGGTNNHLAKGGGNDQNHIYLCNSTNGENDVTDARCDTWRATHVGDFGVIDANATDGDGAILGLPDPCAGDISTDGCTPTYRVFARGHGSGGSATITTCGEEAGAGFDATDDVWCGSNGITVYTKRKAVDVSDNLLRMTITVDGVVNPALATCIGIPTDATTTLNIGLFDRCFENYFWNYDNNGLKLLELRFYFVS